MNWPSLGGREFFEDVSFLCTINSLIFIITWILAPFYLYSSCGAYAQKSQLFL